MKKFLVLSAVLALSACGCINHEDEVEPTVVYQNVQARPQNCDYFDGTTCYRYVRRVHQQPVVRYRETVRAKSSCGCKASQYIAPASVQNCGCGEPQVRETREPVEVVYKKTTYTTRYEPQTTASVSYERAPYSQVERNAVSAPVISRTVAEPVEIVEPEIMDEEILLNVK